MYFDGHTFVAHLYGYATLLWTMLTTSWARAFDEGLNLLANGGRTCSTDIELPNWIVQWWHWEPESFGALLLKAVVAILLMVATAFNLVVALFKLFLWCTGLLPALIIIFLMACKFTPDPSQ
ncbi:hypothetical protein K8Q93_02675 [Candidatus Parcubacteria bacterium]|nr:hypothetical protein [Candidatus Parcubacteria bacterium]